LTSHHVPPTFSTLPDPFADHPNALDAHDAAEQFRDGRLQLIDLLEPHERPAPTVEGARNVPLSVLANDAMTLAHDRPIAFLSGRGRAATLAAYACQGVGMIAHPVAGGLVGWIEAGLPVRDG
jgi:rhodanese-related sulfurtransferase